MLVRLVERLKSRALTLTETEWERDPLVPVTVIV